MPVDPAALQVRFAPRTEDLLSALLENLSRGSPDPLVRECIVVQNRGMQRWLELQLSAHQGVWANPWFPFPEAFVRGLWRRVDPSSSRYGADKDRRVPPDAETLGWAVAALLPGLLDRPTFKPLRAWLGRRDDAGRQLSLARRIAEVLDGYLVDRPDILTAWEADDRSVQLPPDLADLGAEDAAWQAELWRALRRHPSQLIDDHPARIAERLIERLDHLSASTDPKDAGEVAHLRQRLPRVSVFGLSALSAVYLRILGALAGLVPVRIYTLAPSPTDARAVLDIARRAGGWHPGAGPPPIAAEALGLLEPLEAHPLIRGQAAALRGFQMLVALSGARTKLAGDADDPDADAAERQHGEAVAGSAAAAAPRGLLARLQADIARGASAAPAGRPAERPRDGTDRSLGLHSCHGPLREAEVLRDQLLAAFDELPDLAPQDVVVMVPDLETYAPCLQAVFGIDEDGRGAAIPFRIADRPARGGRPGILAFGQALRLLWGRMTAPELLDLLALEPVRAARGVDEEGLDRLRRLVDAVGIRWGIDGAHRQQVGQPGLDGNTWRWGLARLFLGWAAPGDGSTRLAAGEVLPYPAAGAEPWLLGALADLADLLVCQRRQLLDARLTIEGWADELVRFAGQLLGVGEAGREEISSIEGALGSLVERAARAGFRMPLGLDAVTGLLDDALEEDPPPRGFLEGAVTICALQPMRAIPFRVVALIGMNDGAFPRGDRPVGFDLAARRPRLGASIRRDTDRLLFLEALVSARDRFILTWTGQDARSESLSPPSVVVAELLDVLGPMLGPSDDGAAEDCVAGIASERPAEALVQQHALHPYSQRYFPARNDPRWFSYAADYARTADRGVAGAAPRPPLLRAALPPRPAPDPPRMLRLESLLRCWENPARYFLQTRLGISLPGRQDRLADREPLTLDPLLRWRVGDALVATLLQGAELAESRSRLAAQGLLPLGTPGALAVADLFPAARAIADLARPLRRGVARILPLDLPLLDGSVHLTGSLDDLYEAGRVEAGYGRLDARRGLRLWLRHLALCALIDRGDLSGTAPCSWAAGRPGDAGNGSDLLRLERVPDAAALLEALVAGCLRGENAPLPFYPAAARAFARSLGSEGLRLLAAKGEAGPGPGPAVDLVEARRLAAEAFGAGRDEDAASAWSARKDRDDPYLALILGDAAPWDEEGQVADEAWDRDFGRLAALVYGPFLAAAVSDAATEDPRPREGRS